MALRLELNIVFLLGQRLSLVVIGNIHHVFFETIRVNVFAVYGVEILFLTCKVVLDFRRGYSWIVSTCSISSALSNLTGSVNMRQPALLITAIACISIVGTLMNMPLITKFPFPTISKGSEVFTDWG